MTMFQDFKLQDSELQDSTTDSPALQETEPNPTPNRPLRWVEIWGGRLAMLGVTAIAMAIAQGTI